MSGDHVCKRNAKTPRRNSRYFRVARVCSQRDQLARSSLLRCWGAFIAARKWPSGKKTSMQKDKILENASTKPRKSRACGNGTICRRGAYLGILFCRLTARGSFKYCTLSGPNLMGEPIVPQCYWYHSSNTSLSVQDYLVPPLPSLSSR